MKYQENQLAWIIKKMNKYKAWLLCKVVWTLQLLKNVKNPVVVEVGVYLAEYGCAALDIIPDLTWYGVDPYIPYEGGHLFRGVRKKYTSIRYWNHFYKETVLPRISKYGLRFKLIRETSEIGISSIPEGVDFIFIDGHHNYEFVKMDLLLYEKKLKKGGIMSGHDYTHRTFPGVRKAVDEYAQKNNIEINQEFFDPAGIWWWRKK